MKSFRKPCKKVVKLSQHRQMAKAAVENRRISIRFACQIFSVSESCYRYTPKLDEENQQIAEWLLCITDSQRTWGFGLCYLYLRNVKGFGWNPKRFYRIYCELSLNMRIKPKKRLKREEPEPLSRQCLNHRLNTPSVELVKKYRPAQQ